MSDPKRWTEETPDGDLPERELVLAGQRDALSSDQHHAIWTQVAAACPPVGTAGLAGASAKTAAKAAGTLGSLSSGLVLLATSGGLVGLGYWALHDSPAAAPAVSSERAPSAEVSALPSAPSLPSTRLPRSPASAVALEPAPLPTASDRSATAAAETGARASLLQEESRAILQARTRLRAGDAAGALQLLERARRRYPRGALVQEREALTIEALAKTGATQAAKERGHEFLRAYPNSPHAADVRAQTKR